MQKPVYDEYDSFAFFYNRYWTISTPKLMKKVLNKLLFPDLEKNSKVLDICCGTGNTAAVIKSVGYDVYGIDGSLAMLAYANQNAAGVDFIHDDARYFALDFKLDAITCLFDSVNHFLSEDDLSLLFNNVYAHLKPDAKFIFDINSLKSSVTVGDSSFSIVTDEDVFICNPEWFKDEERIRYYLTMFIKDNGSWLRNDHIIIEQYYPIEKIISLLTKSGFHNLSIFDGFADLRIKEFKDRIFITAWR